MTITLTPPAADLELDGTATISTSTVGTTDTQVWVTEVGGPRLVQVPTAALTKVEWSERLGAMPSSSATIGVDRYALLDDEDPDSWVVAELEVRLDRAPREVQILHQGRVVFWGPILSTSRQPGAASVDVSCSGCEYWWGTRLVTDVDEDVFGVEQIRPPAVFDPVLDIGGTTWEWARAVWFERSDWRFTARVWVDAAVDNDTPILQAVKAGGSNISGQSATVYAWQLTRDAWTTAVIHLSVETSGPATIGQDLSVIVGDDSTSAGDVLLEEVTAQVSPTSVGLDEMSDPEVRRYTTRESWLELVTYVSDLGFVGWAESQGPSGQAGWKRPDVFIVEGARQLTESGNGCEAAIGLTPTLRVAQLWDLRGVEHDPEVLTLEAGSTVVSWGGWQTGLGQPITEWIVANDEGFTASFHDTSMLGGFRLQQFSAAPTGTSASSLAGRARHAARLAASEGSEQVSAVVAMDLEADLAVGDRVHVVIDDGPDQWDDLMRVTSKSVTAGAAGFEVSLAPWVEP